MIAFAWQTPIRERLPWTKKEVKQVRLAQPALVPPASSGSWMWDPDRSTTLDRPAYNRQDRVWRTDRNGRKYWVDQFGRRQYDE